MDKIKLIKEDGGVVGLRTRVQNYIIYPFIHAYDIQSISNFSFEYIHFTLVLDIHYEPMHWFSFIICSDKSVL